MDIFLFLAAVTDIAFVWSAQGKCHGTAASLSMPNHEIRGILWICGVFLARNDQLTIKLLKIGHSA
jgi:hypothetical protein